MTRRLFTRVARALLHFVATCSCPCGCAVTVKADQAMCSACATYCH